MSWPASPFAVEPAGSLREEVDSDGEVVDLGAVLEVFVSIVEEEDVGVGRPLRRLALVLVLQVDRVEHFEVCLEHRLIELFVADE